MLRFAGGLHIANGGRVVVEAEVGLEIIALRLRKDIFELYGHNTAVSRLGGYKAARYQVCGAQRQRW